MYENYEAKDLKGIVLRFEKSSIYDGDGLRTVVFLKGCPLRCQWCSTPESQKFQIEKTEKNIYGMEMTVGEVIREVKKDSLFYFHSGGGMTLSGGEITAQPEFSYYLLKAAKWECINTAIETSFFAKWENIEPMLEYVDTAFIDLKFFDQELHKKYCGVDNTLILENMKKASQMADDFRMVIRMPLIPGVNDSEEELRQKGEFCSKLEKVAYIETLPYHRLGTSTYEKLNMPYLLRDVEVPSEEHMEWCRSILREYGKTVK